MIINANSIQIPLEDKSVHMCVTSPPYYGLRDYGLPGTLWQPVTYTPMAGLPALTVPGCDPECEHVWGEEKTIVMQPQRDHGSNGDFGDTRGEESWRGGSSGEVKTGSWCQRCGGWRGCLGLEPTPEMFVAHIVLIFREVWRVLRDDGTLWLNFGDSYANSGKSGSQRDASGGFSGRDKGTRGEQGYSNASGAGIKRSVPSALKPKDLMGIPWRVAFALQADGWWLRSDIIEEVELYCPCGCGHVMEERVWRHSQDRDIIWHKPNPMPESVTDRCTKSHEYLFMLAKSKRYYYDAEAVKEKAEYGRRTWSDVESNMASLTTANDKRKHHGIRKKASVTGKNPSTGRNRRTVWTISTRPYKGAHFATFPTDLVRPCILAGTSAKGVCPVCGKQWERVVEKSGISTYEEMKDDGVTHEEMYEAAKLGWRPTCNHYEPGIIEGLDLVGKFGDPIPAKVLDLFCGSGTTGQVCKETRRKFIGLDLSITYLRDFALIRAEKKETKASMQTLPLFKL